MIPHFHNNFFSQSMRQLFNRVGAPVAANENEPPLRVYLRATGQL